MSEKQMTRSELVNLLNSRGGCCPVGLLTETEPALKKTGNPNKGKKVVRVTRRNGFVGGSYESIVNNAQEREGEARNFEAMPLPWGEHRGRFFIEHKGQMYLKFFPLKSGCNGEDRWEVDGVAVDFSVIEPFLTKPSDSRSGVPWRVITLTNVKEVSLDGDVIRLVG
jgi:hypothetical protein